MRIKGSTRSSILLLSRNSVIIGVIIIAVTGFGLGYFFGYRGSGHPALEKEDLTAEQRELFSSEDRRVLEPSGENKPVIMPPVAPLFPGDPGHSEVPAQIPEISSIERRDRELLPEYKDIEKDEHPTAALEKIPEPKAAVDDSIKKDKTDAKTEDKPVDKTISGSDKRIPKSNTTVPADTASPKRVYTVQIGAFPSRDGAEKLQRMLKAKEIESYIVNGTRNPYFKVRVGSFKSRKEAERNAVILEKKTGMKNFVTTK